MNLIVITLSLFVTTNKIALVSANNNNIRKHESASTGRLVNRIAEENLVPFTVCPYNCATWFDGCNTCKCSGDGNNEFMRCTELFCPKPKEAYCMEEEAKVCPHNCATWYDGCNKCECSSDGTNKMMGCTEKFCSKPGEAYCLDSRSKEDSQDDRDYNCVIWYDGCNTCNEMGCTEMFCSKPGEAYCLDYANLNDSQNNKCVRYGDIIHFQMSNVTSMWLASDGPVDQGSIITKPFNQREVSAYEWIITSGGDKTNKNDPRTGECIQYQDKVNIQMNNIDNMWLTGGRGKKNRKVAIRDHFSETESKNQLVYTWTINRSITNGNMNNRIGDDVRYDGDIFLQIDNVDNRWLTGDLGIGGSIVRTIGYAYTNKWTVRKSNSQLI